MTGYTIYLSKCKISIQAFDELFNLCAVKHLLHKMTILQNLLDS